MKLYKIKMFIIRIIYIAFIFVFSAIIIFMGNGYIEFGVVKNQIVSFENRGEYIKTSIINNQEVNIYEVEPYYDYEKQDNRTVFNYQESDFVGSKGDIFLTSSNPIKNFSSSLIKDIVGYLARRIYIGHAAVNITSNGDKIIESVGNDDLFYGVRTNENNWLKNTLTAGTDEQILIGLRIKDMTNDSIDNYVNNLLEQVGKEYNMNFLFSKKNAYYCTDLITRIGNKSDLNLNYDKFFSTGNDIIISDDTFVIFVCERISNGKFNLYFLKGE